MSYWRQFCTLTDFQFFISDYEGNHNWKPLCVFIHKKQRKKKVKLSVHLCSAKIRFHVGLISLCFPVRRGICMRPDRRTADTITYHFQLSMASCSLDLSPQNETCSAPGKISHQPHRLAVLHVFDFLGYFFMDKKKNWHLIYIRWWTLALTQKHIVVCFTQLKVLGLKLAGLKEA